MKIVDVGLIIFILDRHCQNVIVGKSPDGLIVTTKGDPELVEREWIKTVRDTLEQNRTIKADDIIGTARYRSSFIMALLAKLEYVNYEI